MQATASRVWYEPESRTAVAPSVRVAVITVLILATLIVLSLYQLTPPSASSPGAALSEFSSGRAMAHLAAIAKKPHPSGSPEHENVAAYIIHELTTIGLNPEIQETTVVSQRRGFPFAGASVKNILVRLPGTSSSKAVLFVSHYDSVPTGPGASDDGAAVAAMIEALRALRVHAPLRNDLLFLFTDAEEPGLLGAKAFVDENPAVRDVGVVLNFEARGNGGPSIMFETSTGNGWLIKEFARAATHPIANSLSYEIYKRLPNDTDLSIFKEAGFAGLNFAYIKGLNHYHTQIDNIESIDERSLQHHGTYLVSLARHFGDLDIVQSKDNDAVYFNFLGSILVHYSVIWVKYLAALASMVLAAAVAFGLRSRQLTLRGIGIGFLALLVSMIASALFAALLWRIIGKLHGQYSFIFQSDAYNGSLYLLSVVFLSLAITSTVYVWALGRRSVEDLVVGALIWWSILTVLTGVYLPGGSWLFTWPLLSSSIGLCLMLASKSWRPASPKGLAVISFFAIPGVFLLVPMIYLVFIAMTLNMSAALAVMVTLLFGLLIPHLKLVALAKRWLAPVSALLVTIAFLVAGSFTSGFDSAHRQPDSIFYALNADSAKAVWASFDRRSDEWTSQVFANNVERGSLTEYIPSNYDGFMKTPATTRQFEAPAIELLGDSTKDGIRTLRLRIISARQAPVMTITASPEMEVLSYAVNQRQMANKTGQRWGLRYYALAKDGLELTLQLLASGPVRLSLTDQSYELPQGFNEPLKPRPDYLMPSIMPYSDSTLVTKSFNF
jgi:hypothetical protein